MRRHNISEEEVLSFHNNFNENLIISMTIIFKEKSIYEYDYGWATSHQNLARKSKLPSQLGNFFKEIIWLVGGVPTYIVLTHQPKIAHILSSSDFPFILYSHFFLHLNYQFIKANIYVVGIEY